MGSSTAAPQPSPSTSTPAASSSFYPRDCSQGICSSVCPQFCTTSNNYYFLGPPPPPLLYADDSSDSSRVSPLMIALISVLAAAFLLLSYYTFASRCCKRRRSRWSRNDDDDELQLQTRLDQLVLRDSAGATSFQLPAVNSDGGLDEQFIRSITVFKYNKGDGLVESTDCAVCLTEFQETESLRLMPNCQHAFHPPCIDTWLRSHSNCPICRSSMIGAPPPPPPLPARRQPPAVVSRMRVQRGGDVVVVVDGAAARDRVREIGGLDLRRQGSPAEEGEGEGEVDVTPVVGKEIRRGDEQFNH